MVPEQVPLLGVDNDELECNLSHPPLSSVDIPAKRIGYEAARLLDQLLAGERPKQTRYFLAPIRIVTRRSTDTVALEDTAVSAAMAFIHRHATDDIGVDSVLDEVPLSRRVLERRFRELLGSSVLDEIRRCRVEHAKRLLVETDLGMPRIAILSGFSNARRLAVVFSQLVKMTPTAFRARSRMRR